MRLCRSYLGFNLLTSRGGGAFVSMPRAPYLGYLAAQEGVKELAVHEEPRPNDILAYFLVGVTKDMRLKGFSELAATTRAACTMLPRKTSVGGMRVFVWNQLTARCKYVIYKKHTPTRRKRPRPEPAPARRSADGP